MPVAEALQRVLADAQPLPRRNDRRSTMRAAACSPKTWPRCARSRQRQSRPWTAMRCAPATLRTAPVTLKVIGEVAAGHPFDGTVAAGQAARIFTGGVMPEAATRS